MAVDDDVHDIVLRPFVVDVDSAGVAADRSSDARLTNRIARVEVGKKWGLINEKGEYVVPPKFEFVVDGINWMIIHERPMAPRA